MPAVARTSTLIGVAAHEVLAEVDVHGGLPAFSLVGLPDAAVRESRERVRAALLNSGLKYPQQRITANLAPADLRKAGPGFDLAIAAALLGASEQLPATVLDRFWLAGELALDGSVRPVAGVLAMAEEARRRGAEGIVVAAENAAEAALVPGLAVAPLSRIDELAALADGHPELCLPQPAEANGSGSSTDRSSAPDLAELRGQRFLRRALEVAAGGGHSLLVVGPPGCGKSMAARILPNLIPPPGREEALEVARVASACGHPPPPDGIPPRPFRAPHHTISAAGLVGGGNPPRPGEVTLAHGGVLFLDELGEFGRATLEALRQPLEEGRVTVARARHTVEMPCRFLLVAAANPCPCGRGADDARCRCAPHAVLRYESKLSGALSDRIDLSVSVEQPDAEALGGGPGEGSGAVAARVAAARERQRGRLGGGRTNASMSPPESRRHARLTETARAALATGHGRLGLSGRGHERVLRVARTIADLEGAARVDADHVAEALTMRRRPPSQG